MGRARTRFICEGCAFELSQWHGRCPSCGEWNTIARLPEPRYPSSARRRLPAAAPVSMGEVEMGEGERLPTGMEELDRALGGGLVPGAVVLLAGDPGIGKSTLLLQAASRFAALHGTCLYVSGEESLQQVAIRGTRLSGCSAGLLLLAETDVEVVADHVQHVSPRLLVVDSIQAMYSPDTDSLPGGVGQVRDCAARLVRMAKETGVPVFVVGHVTKEGVLAGPRLLEHMVDTVLSLEGDRHSGCRILRASKNRFGPTDELGLFRMTESGLEGVPDASAALLAERQSGRPGSSVAAVFEGSRPLLVEIQALVSGGTQYGAPRRSVTGMDYGRTCLVIAVLEKRAGLSLTGADVFVNVPGGVEIREPAADLGLALAIASSFKEVPVRPDTACVGEVGLTGETRTVPRTEGRLAELARQGFGRCLMPPRSGTAAPPGMKLVPVGNLHEALDVGLVH